jgi:PAS domain S-box-containing protein
MAGSFEHGDSDRRWALAAAALTTLVAAADLALGADVVLLGLFVFGPLLAAGRASRRATAGVGLYAVALGIAAGAWNDVFFDTDHVTRLPVVIGGSLVAVWIAGLRQRSERTREHLVAQNALAVTLVEARSLADGTPTALESIGRQLDWQLGALWTVSPRDQMLRLVDVWKDDGVEATGFVGLSRRTAFARGEGLPGRAWDLGEPVWSEDVTREEGYTRATVAREAGLSAALAFPVFGEDRVLGAVEFYAREIRAPHPELLRLLRGFGSQLGQFIELKQAETLARESEALKTLIFDTALDAVISIDGKGHVVEFNPAAERIFGYTREDVLGREMAELIIPEGLRDAHRAALRRVVGGAEPRLLGQRLELTGMHADGSEFPIELSITTVAPQGGHTALFTGFVRDITSRKDIERERASLLVRERDSRREAEAAQRRTEFIAEVGTVLDTALDYQEALQELARIAVPRLGEWCVIDVLDADGSIGRYAAAHANPDRAQMMEALRDRYPADPGAADGLPRAIRTGESQLIPVVTDEMLAVGRIAQDEEHARMLRELGFRSAMVVPLRARGRILGAVGLALGSESDRTYGPEDLTYAEDLARRAALALDNSRLFTERVRAEEELRRSKEELDFILAGVADGVTAQAPDGSLIYANEAAVVTLGCETLDELLGTPVSEVMNRFEVFDEDGDPFPVDAFPGRIALLGRKPGDAVMRFRVKETGEERWSVVKATPILDTDGSVLMAINVFEDITAHKESELRARFLADAAAVLAGSLDYEITLQQVAELAIPTFADSCIVELADQDGQLVPVAMAHTDPDKVALMRTLREEYPADQRAPRGSGHVFRSGVSELYAEIDPELIRGAVTDERQLDLLESLGVTSAMIVPMSSGGRRLGTIAFALSESARRYDRPDLSVAEELGRRAAVAIDNARLYRERSYIARTLQESLLPPELPDVAGAEIAARFHAAGEATEVGGDFYDLFDTSHGWGIVMGDVCGKGADAAAVTALARYTLRTLGVQQTSPAEVLRGLNDALLRQRTDRRFCTVAYASMNLNGSGTADVCLATGGHPLPFVLRADGSVEAVGEPGTLLGVLPEVRLNDTPITLHSGDLLLLYTDGVTEARGPGGMLGSEELAALLVSCAGMDAISVAARIESAALEIQEGNPRDDIAILAVRIR